MSILQSNILSGVQALPRGTTPHKISTVQTVGDMSAGNFTSLAVTLAVDFGLTTHVERILKLAKSVQWRSTRSHMTGLHEYEIHVPVETGKIAHLDMSQYVAMYALEIPAPETCDKETLYVLASHPRVTGSSFPCVVVAVVTEFSGSSMTFYPPIEKSAVRLELPVEGVNG